MESETRYARADDGVRIAYQRFGEGSVDLVYLPYFLFNIDLFWDFEPLARWLSGLAEFARVIMHDPRGTGLSDREAEPGDARAAGRRRPGGPRRRGRRIGGALRVTFGRGRRRVHGREPPGSHQRPRLAPCERAGGVGARLSMGPERRGVRAGDREAESRWGSSEDGQAHAASQGPMGQVDAGFQRWMAKMFRSAVTPARAESLLRAWFATDVRGILPQLGTPTLVLARESTVDESRAVASMIPGASFVQLPGLDHMPWFGDTGAVLDATRSFLGVEQRAPDAERFLATVLFTDIVDSTSRAASVGDERWKQIVGEHHRLIRGLLDRHHGTEMDTAGDGSTRPSARRATGPDAPWTRRRRWPRSGSRSARACTPVRSNAWIASSEAWRPRSGLGLFVGGRVPGARVIDGQDLTAGSGLVFEDAGEHELKGVPDRWHLYRVVGQAT